MTGSDQSIVRETDVVRQAELVTMEYLKSWKCAESLDTLMTKTGTKASSSVASELYAADLEKKKAMGKHSSVLEYLVSSSVDQVKSETSSSRRRSSVDSSCSSSSSGDKEVAWSKDELSLLRKAIKQTNSVDDKNDRWKQIAVLVGNGKSKKHCYVKYKELKQEQSGGKSSSSKTRPSTSEPRVRRDSVALMKEGKGSIPLLDAKEEEEFTAKSSSFVKTEVAKELRPVNAPAQKMEELEMEDCDDLESVVPAGRKPVISFQDRPASSSANITRATRAPTSEEVASLRQLLFGEDKKSFSSHWQEQGFFFSKAKGLQYGLVQHEGGPCGVLAVVQAYTLRFLLQSGRGDWQNPDASDQRAALASALAHILWQATAPAKSCCTIALNAGRNGSNGFMTGLALHSASSEAQTKALLLENLNQLMAPRGNGLLLFVYSVLLSKGIEHIKSEMDDVDGSGQRLIGAHDYCTQELVNLLLCGQACSNVFNDRQLLEGTSMDDPKAVVLKGIPAQATVGFLSLFEAYEYLVVGSYLKTPRVPIWVVCSESHYSVLFASPEQRQAETALQESRPQVAELFYFDGLANQDEVIRLSVHTHALPERVKPNHEDLTPPLNLVIQTKWPLATVDWNGVEPLL